jgi:hypothetical protein
MIEAKVYSAEKLIFHSDYPTDTLQNIILKVEKYIVAEGLNEYEELTIRVMRSNDIKKEKIELENTKHIKNICDNLKWTNNKLETKT